MPGTLGTRDTTDIKDTSDTIKWALFRVYIHNLIVYYVRVMDNVLFLMVSNTIKHKHNTLQHNKTQTYFITGQGYRLMVSGY